MVIKLVLAQIQFVAVLIVASVVLLPFITGSALLLWWDEPLLVRFSRPTDRLVTLHALLTVNYYQ